MPKVKPYATECHRCAYNGGGHVECLECDGKRYGQPSKRGHVIVSLDSLTELGGDIHRDELSPLSSPERARPRYSHRGLVRLVAESLPKAHRAAFRAAWGRVRDGDVSPSVGALAVEAGIPRPTLLAACAAARERMGEVRRAECEIVDGERVAA